jgi:hypothetical protein
MAPYHRFQELLSLADADLQVQIYQMLADGEQLSQAEYRALMDAMPAELRAEMRDALRQEGLSPS